MAAPASTAEALEMVLDGLSYLAAADPTALAAQAQAECLQTLEHADAIATARARILAAFTAGQGHAADADYSPTSWLIHRTRITKGAARGHLGWARRAAAHPQVVAALAEGTVLSASIAGLICGWTDKLPESCRQTADDILIAAARAGARKEDLAALAAEIYARSLPDSDDDPEPDFEDRQLRVETTFAGAGVISGDLTPEATAVVTAVLEALSAPRGAEDTRTQEQRYHDALEDAMRRLVASGLLPERAGQPVKVWAHVSLAELRALDDGSVLAQEWVGEMAVRWAARRAAASQAGGDGAAWLAGKPARAMACDAAIIPVVTGGIDPGVLDDLVGLCLQYAGHGPHCAASPDADRPQQPGQTADPARPAEARTQRTGSASLAPATGQPRTHRPMPTASPRTRRPTICPAAMTPARPPAAAPRPGRGPPRRRARRCSGRRSSAGPSTWSPAPAGSPASCGPGWPGPGWPGRPCRWTSGTAPRSPPRSAARSSCATSTAAGPAAATSPPPPAKSTTSPTWPTAAPPASTAARFIAFSTTTSRSTSGAGPSPCTPTAPPPPAAPTAPKPCTATARRPPAPGEPGTGSRLHLTISVVEVTEVESGLGQETVEHAGPVLHPPEPGLDQRGQLANVVLGEVGQRPFQVRPDPPGRAGLVFVSLLSPSVKTVRRSG